MFRHKSFSIPIFVIFFFHCPVTVQAQIEGKEFKAKVIAEWKTLFETIHLARWEKKGEYYSSADPKNLNEQIHQSNDTFRFAFIRDIGRLWAIEAEYFSENIKINERGNRELIVLANKQYTAELKKTKERSGWLLGTLKQDKKTVTTVPFS